MLNPKHIFILCTSFVIVVASSTIAHPGNIYDYKIQSEKRWATTTIDRKQSELDLLESNSRYLTPNQKEYRILLKKQLNTLHEQLKLLDSFGDQQ